MRGIKTTTEVVQSYLENIFSGLLSNEEEFLENLSTPFVSNPLQELKKTHNIRKEKVIRDRDGKTSPLKQRESVEAGMTFPLEDDEIPPQV